MKYLIIILLYLIVGCQTSQKTVQKMESVSGINTENDAGPPVMVYKTKADYNNYVPVLLSDDKSEIVSYPHPNDIKTENGYAVPTLLNDGYLLDNRGINKNVAFLKITYQQYAKLDHLLSLEEMIDLIIDKDPLTELCDCGSKQAFTDLKKQLNQIIDSYQLRSTCKIIK